MMANTTNTTSTKTKTKSLQKTTSAKTKTKSLELRVLQQKLKEQLSVKQAYTATFRNNSTGILFTRKIIALSRDQARERARSFKRAYGNWCSLVTITRSN